jgi:anti-sigma-K factor RskA
MNRDLNCDQAESLVEAYVLQSLEEQELCAFTAHVAECRRHDDDLTALRAVAARLPVAIDPVAPPSRLRSDLLRSFDVEVAAPTAGLEEPVAPARAGVWRLFRSTGFAYGLAAALVAISVGLGVLALTAGDDDAGVTRIAVSQGGASMRVVYEHDSHLGLLQVDLPQLAPGRAYQAWFIPSQGNPVSMGVLSSNQGPMAFNVDLSNATALAISVEPAGGSPQPTTTPILVAEL